MNRLFYHLPFFSQNAYVNGSLWVPASSVELFGGTDVWKNFFRIEGM